MPRLQISAHKRTECTSRLVTLSTHTQKPPALATRIDALLLLLQVLSPKDRQNDEYGALHASGIHCTGRIVLNVWRILRSELKLNIYTFESCVAAVLQLRTPHVQPHVLTQWFNAGPAGLHTSHSLPGFTLTIILS
jgi:DNA polymerase elongation subunit (family B)